jgi:NAD(P)-dependent dehydrogenase (short-subunit alcohol dehydrogenase family)
MHPSGDMNGKVALVTGASGGLGRTVVHHLARAGANLVLVDIAADRLEPVAREARAMGVEVHAHATDLACADNCPAAVGVASEAFGRLDALCNVAGVMAQAHSHAMPVEDFSRIFAVNVTAPFAMIQAAIPMLLESKGAVVNVASSTGVYPAPYLAAYGSSKAALIHMTRALAAEYMNRAIRFNAVAPGAMMTAMIASQQALPDLDAAVAGRNMPARGLVDVEEVAATIAFLASSASRGHHGACIVIDHGMSL